MDGRILIVDDQAMNIDILAENLGDIYTIMPAMSGRAAIKILEQKKPDLVILDVSMPDIDGFEVLEYMKKRKELFNIPVIFVTGAHETDLEKKGLSLGAVDYIKKPFDLAVVRTKVKNHLNTKAYHDNLESLVQIRTKQLYASREAIIMGMSLISDSHDKVTGEHIVRIKENTRILTDKILELYPNLITPELARHIVLYSPLHDIGKVAIPDAVLKKDGLLTPEEFEIMKSHAIEGANVLRKTEMFLGDDIDINNEFQVAVQIAECHHERYDGTGYPHGLAGEDIPISARIVAMADVYDALRSPRQYKKALSHKDAMNVIVSGDHKTKSIHFDPKVMRAFFTSQGELERFYMHR